MKRKKKELVFSSQIVVVFLAIIFLLTTWSSAQMVEPQVTAGDGHTVGLKFDGTVIAVGRDNEDELNVGSWADIVQVSAGEFHTVGLRSNGTVVAVGWDKYGQLNVGSWADIVQVSAGCYHTIGLRSDGTVVAVGWDEYGQLNVGSWADIKQVAAGCHHTVGLRSNGTVIAVGRDNEGQLNVGSWADIVQVAGFHHTVGLRSDGTVVAVGWDEEGQLNVGSWADIVQVDAGSQHTVGLKSDGKVVAVGWDEYGQLNVGSWADIVQVAAGDNFTVGLRSNGTVVVVGYSAMGQGRTDDWHLMPDHTLTVGKSVTGSGTVTATGISCGPDCSEIYIYGTEVTLTASASMGSSFVSWSGCDSESGNECTVIMTEDKSVTASFTLNQYTLNVAKAGNGTGDITGAGISCGTDCTHVFDYGTEVDLTATALKGSSFTSWSGCDSASGNTCIVTIAGDESVSASFTLNKHTLTVEKSDTSTGTGTLTGTGISCGTNCSEEYNYGTMVAITPNSDTGSVFVGWSGCDSVTGNICNVIITGDRTITATFHLEYSLQVNIGGIGGGKITSVPSGIDCEPTCISTFVVGTPIRLTAQPPEGSFLALWSGGCSGTEETCDLTMTDFIEVTAYFVPYGTKEYKLKVKKAKKNKGDGTVTSNDGNINCGETCSYTYFRGTTVTFSSTANEGSTFIGWKPTTLNCTGTGPCTVTIDKAKSVQAVFLGDYALKVVNKSKKGGTGTVTSTPIGINCATGSTSDCIALYGYGETVTLSASSDTGSVFVGWSPTKLCPGVGDCVVPMDKRDGQDISDNLQKILSGSPLLFILHPLPSAASPSRHHQGSCR